MRLASKWESNIQGIKYSLHLRKRPSFKISSCICSTSLIKTTIMNCSTYYCTSITTFKQWCEVYLNCSYPCSDKKDCHTVVLEETDCEEWTCFDYGPAKDGTKIAIKIAVISLSALMFIALAIFLAWKLRKCRARGGTSNLEGQTTNENEAQLPTSDANEAPQGAGQMSYNFPRKFYDQTCIYFNRLKRRRELNRFARDIKLDCFTISSDSEEQIIDPNDNPDP